MNGKAILGASVGLLIIAIPACIYSNAETEAILAEVEANSAKQEASERWEYREQRDEMRGTIKTVAYLKADGPVDFMPELIAARVDGESYIGIRGSLDLQFAEQMRCPTGTLNIKFDDGPIRQVGCEMGMVVSIDPSIFDELKKSDVTWIEAHTSHMTTSQYKFNTRGLEI